MKIKRTIEQVEKELAEARLKADLIEKYPDRFVTRTYLVSPYLNISDQELMARSGKESTEIVEKKIKLKKRISKLELELKGLEREEETSQRNQTPYYRYDYSDKTFEITNNGSINFKTKEGKAYQATLFEIILEYWQLDDNRPSKILKTKVLSEVLNKLGEQWDRDKLKSNLGHLHRKIQTNPKISRLVLFERHYKEYIRFNIKNPFQ